MLKYLALVLALAAAVHAAAKPSPAASEIFFSEHSQYYLSREQKLSWTAAKSFCEGRGSQIVSIDSEDENAFVFEIYVSFSDNRYHACWIGGRRDLSGSAARPYSWQWADNSSIAVFAEYANCTRGQDCLWDTHGVASNDEPNNKNGDEYCLAYAIPGIASNPGTWNDDSCARRHKFVCEKEIALSPNTAWQAVSLSATGRYQAAAEVHGDGLGNIWVSQDHGASWQQASIPANERYAVSISSTGRYQTAADANGALWLSSDFGRTWAWVQGPTGAWYAAAVSATGRFQTAVLEDGAIWVSSNFGSSWGSRGFAASWYSVAVSGVGQYQTAVATATASSKGYIAISSTSGAKWNIALSSDTAQFYSVSVSSTGRIQTVIDGAPGLIHVSYNYGKTWNATGFSAEWFAVSISSNGQNQVAAIWGGGIYLSLNYGKTWQLSNAPASNWSSVSVSSSGQYATAGENEGYLWVSSNYGQDWTRGRDLPTTTATPTTTTTPTPTTTTTPTPTTTTTTTATTTTTNPP